MSASLVIGGGYLGSRVATKLKLLGSVSIITRSLARHPELNRQGFETKALDIASADFFLDFTKYTRVLFCPAVTVDRKKTGAKHHLYCKGLSQVLDLMVRQGYTGNLVVIGSTSLFPSMQSVARQLGNTTIPDFFNVDEETIDTLTHDTTNASLEQYLLWKSYKDKIAFNSTYIISSGIYGPDRHPARRLLQGLCKTEQHPGKWINLIHIDDLVNITYHAILQTQQHPCFCASDGNPLSIRDFYAMYTRVLKLPEVEYVHADQTGFDGKRVQNKRLLSMGFPLIHPRFTDEFILQNQSDFRGIS